MHGTRVSAGLDRAIMEAANARRIGNPEMGIQRLEGMLSELGETPGGPRCHWVPFHYERGLCHLSLGEASAARTSFSRALESAGADWQTADPARAALALLEMMDGRFERAQARLAGRGNDRQATLLSLARLHLAVGYTDLAQGALDRAAHSPGGSRDVHPPAAALRALAQLWSKDGDLCGAITEGISEPTDAFWLFVRILNHRAAWTSSGQSRHLILALGAAQELSFLTSSGRAPDFRPIALSQLALLSSLTGDTVRSVQLGHEAFDTLRTLSIPEWPRQAVLHDLAFVFRAAGDEQAHGRALSRLEAPPTALWLERLSLVTGPRGRGALEPQSALQERRSPLNNVALELLEQQASPHGVLLRGLMATTGAHGARWRKGSRLIAAAGSGCTLEGEKGVDLLLAGEQTIELLGCSVEDTVALHRATLDQLVEGAQELSLNQEKIDALCEALEEATLRRDSAVRALERARRGPVASVTGGTFPAFAGSSPMIRAVLDRLGLLASSSSTVLIEGLAGSGRRHLARSLHGALGGVLGECPMLDMKVVPPEVMREALLRLEHEADGGVFVASSAEALPPETLSWLLNRIETGEVTGRLVMTLDITTSGPIAETLRSELAHGRIVVPALEDRIEDLPALIDALAFQLGLTPELIDVCARKVLAQQRWPQQVRTLKKHLAAAMVRAAGGVIREEHLVERSDDDAPDRMSLSLDAGYHDAIRVFRRDLLRHALTVSAGNRTHAARLLGVQRTYFMRLIRDLGADDIRPAA
jgi:DNA-binding NtrC family response regulator